MPLLKTDIPQKATGLQLDILDGDWFLFQNDKTQALHLNASAVMIWELCDGERTVGELIDFLQAKYGNSDDDDIGSDVKATLETLYSHHAITTTG